MSLYPCSVSSSSFPGPAQFFYHRLFFFSPHSTQACPGSWHCEPSPSSWGIFCYSVNKGPISPVYHRDRRLMKCLTSGSTDWCWLPSSSSPYFHLLLPWILGGIVFIAGCCCGWEFPWQSIVKARSGEGRIKGLSLLKQRNTEAVLPWQPYDAVVAGAEHCGQRSHITVPLCCLKSKWAARPD